jgi:hypothetical protein
VLRGCKCSKLVVTGINVATCISAWNKTMISIVQWRVLKCVWSQCHHCSDVWSERRSLKIFMMTAEMNKALRDYSGFQWNYDGNGDHWNIVWWQWRSLKFCIILQWKAPKFCNLSVETTEITCGHTGDHWKVVYLYWRSLKCCSLTVDGADMLFDEWGRR